MPSPQLFPLPKADWRATGPGVSVSSQSPATGTLFQKAPVTLAVSKGPQFVTVPPVINKPEGEANSILVGLGLKVKIERPFGGADGTVRLQSVAPGTSVPRGTTITLIVV